MACATSTTSPTARSSANKISGNPSTLSFGGGTITTNAAGVTLRGASTVFTEINGLATNQGSFTVANGRNFTTAGALTNSGTLVVAGGSTVTVPGSLTQSATGTLAGNGNYAATAFTISGAVNPGGSVSTTTGAFTAGPGTLTLNAAATFSTNTQFNYELGATTGLNDHLNVGGVLTLSGTLNVSALAGFGAGRYDLIDYPIADFAHLLTNDSLVLGSLPSGYNYLLDNTVAGQIDLVVTPTVVPEPGAWMFVVGSMMLWFGKSCIRRDGSVRA